MTPSEEPPASSETVSAPGAPANDYDAVTYPGSVYADTLPERLAAVAILAGMNPAPPGRCRVLELGCGNGLNVLAMAYGLPGSDFLGIDPAGQPIARGRAMIERLGLANLSLRQMGVEELGEEFGQFDYIIAHGLYSWVPAAVREKVMAVCGARLATNGVAFISYNAYPGYHLRALVRGMMRYHMAHFATPEEQIRQSRGLVQFLADSVPEGEVYREILTTQKERIAGYTDGGLFHDDLNVNNHPVYFHEFMAAAEEFGLQYLGEAELPAMREVDCPPAAREMLQQLDPADIVKGEQYRDFLRCRAFRQTLLCRKEVALRWDLRSERIESLFVGGDIHLDAASPNSPARFIGRRNTKLETDRPLVKAALRRLGAAWPAFMAFGELLAQARNEVGRAEDALEAADRLELAAALLQASIAGILELRAHPPLLVAEPGGKPRASALARLQLERGDQVPTLLHGTVRMDNQHARTLLALLDGNHDRAGVRAAMEQALLAAGVDPEAAAKRTSASAMEEGLLKLARLGLIEQ